MEYPKPHQLPGSLVSARTLGLSPPLLQRAAVTWEIGRYLLGALWLSHTCLWHPDPQGGSLVAWNLWRWSDEPWLWGLTVGILGVALTAASVSSLVRWGQRADPADLPVVGGRWEVILEEGLKTRRLRANSRSQSWILSGWMNKQMKHHYRKCLLKFYTF